MKIETAQLIAHACVEVVGKIGRARAEFVVHFTHRGAIRDGYQFLPQGRHVAEDAMPPEVKAAAMATYERRMDKL